MHDEEPPLTAETVQLILAVSKRDWRWEDEERANYDVDTLREEFRRRLYADPLPPTDPLPLTETPP